jgi:hypothetical protein
MRRPTRWLALLACAATVPLAARGDDKARAGSEGGWIALFDGKSLDGWEMIAAPGRKSHWEVIDGTLSGSGEASMLVNTKASYKNFRFRAEIKINDKGNSGMYVRCKEKPGFTDGYEIQINSTHADPVKTGSLYTLVEILEILVPPDTWFTQEVEVRDRDYRGKTVTEFTVKVNDKVLYRFCDFTPQFKEGYFAFQQHDPGSKVSIRNDVVMPRPDK